MQGCATFGVKHCSGGDAQSATSMNYQKSFLFAGLNTVIPNLNLLGAAKWPGKY